MTREEITEKIDELQKNLNDLNSQLLQKNPQAQNLICQLNAYNQMLAEKDKPDKKEKA